MNCLRTLKHWVCWFESHSRHGYLVCVHSVFVLPCVGSGLAMVLLTVLRLRIWSETKRFTDVLCSKWKQQEEKNVTIVRTSNILNLLYWVAYGARETFLFFLSFLWHIRPLGLFSFRISLKLWILEAVCRDPWTGNQRIESQGRYLHKELQTQKNADIYLCPEWDSNPWSQHSSGGDITCLRAHSHCDWRIPIVYNKCESHYDKRPYTYLEFKLCSI
jgi:hypothetical protein